MNIRLALQKEHTKENTEKIVQYVSSSDERLSELMDIFFSKEPTLTQRAAWVVGKLGERDQSLQPYLPLMISNLKKANKHDAVKRNTLRVWQFLDIPAQQMGEVANICFQLLSNQKESIAVKVFSMVILEKIVLSTPELKEELIFLIEEQIPYASPGFKSRGHKVLKKLSQL